MGEQYGFAGRKLSRRLELREMIGKWHTSAHFLCQEELMGPRRTFGYDPCHLVWQVKKIRKLEHGHNRTDPCPLAWQVRKILTGEFIKNATSRAVHVESHSPARRAGRGLALASDKF
jgi:hypothetical protein